MIDLKIALHTIFRCIDDDAKVFLNTDDTDEWICTAD